MSYTSSKINMIQSLCSVKKKNALKFSMHLIDIYPPLTQTNGWKEYRKGTLLRQKSELAYYEA